MYGLEFLSTVQVRFVIIAAFIGIMFDLITGVANAAMHKELSSEKMRIGLWHKCGFTACIILGIYLEWVEQIIDLSSYTGFELPTTIAVCVFIILIEARSNYENIRKMSPEITKSPLEVLHEEDNDK
jgi:phage-related holin